MLGSVRDFPRSGLCSFLSSDLQGRKQRVRALQQVENQDLQTRTFPAGHVRNARYGRWTDSTRFLPVCKAAAISAKPSPVGISSPNSLPSAF